MASKRVTFLINANVANFNKGLARAQRSLRNFGNSAKAMGRSLTTNLTLPIGIAGFAVVKLAVDFEKAFGKIEGLVGIAGDKVQSFKSDVLALSGATGRAPQELADALFFVTSAGIRGQQALNVLEMAAKGAAAGLGETKVIADLVTSAMNAYGPAVLSAQQATDALTATIRLGKRDPAEIAESIGMVLPIASEMGVTFQEVGAAVAAMSRTGSNAGTAVTQLRQILFKILKPAKESEKAFADWGTSGEELRKVLASEGGLMKLLGFLREKMKTNSQAFALAFPRVQALAGALDLMGASADETVRIFADMKDNTGDLDNAFAAAAKTVSFKFNRTLAELKVTGIQMGTMLMPVIAKLLDKIKSGIKWFQGLSTETKKLTIVIFGLAAAAGPAVLLLGGIATAIAAISWPITLVVAAIAVLGAAFIYLWDNWAAIVERISDWSWWKNMLIDMAQFFLKWSPANLMIKGWNWLVGKIPEMWDTVVRYVGDVNWWKELLLKMGRLFLKTNPFHLLFKAIEFLVGFDYSGIFDGISKGLDELEKGIDKNIYSPLQIVNPFEVISDGLESLRGETGEYKTEFGSFTDSMKNGIGATKKALLELGSALGAGIGGGVTAGGTTAGTTPTSGLPGQTGRAMLRGIKLPEVPKSVLPSLNKVADAIENVSTAAKLGTSIIENAFRGMSNSVSDALNSTQNIFQAFGQFFMNFIKGMIIKLVAAAIAAIVLAAALQALGVPTGGMAGITKGMSFGKSIMAGIKTFSGMAGGGIVPSGFPNDTYPAGLTSGEMVIPSPQKLPDFGGGGHIADVRFPMRDFVIAFKREEQKMSNSG